MHEKISVLIITHNREKMLAGCLESLVKQTRAPYEIIVVDNASNDNTKEIILSFKKRLPIKYVEEKQIGIPYARNRGIKEASGTLLLMLDDDCVADKLWIEKMVEAHRKYPKAWAIQGKTYSLPKNGICSMLVESDRILWLLSYAKKSPPLKQIKTFFSKDFKEETAIFTCDAKNFSIKTSYIKHHKLSFDTDFYRGEDTDFGKQIIQKKGTIIFYPNATVGHFERSSLKEFLEQQWHIGRTNARIGNKWRTSSFSSNIPRLKTIFTLFLFCQNLNQLHKLPILMLLLFLDRLSRINGWFYEKRFVSFAKQ